MVLSIGSEWLASSLLQLIPQKRITAHEAMREEYFACLPQAVHSIDNCENAWYSLQSGGWMWGCLLWARYGVAPACG